MRKAIAGTNYKRLKGVTAVQIGRWFVRYCIAVFIVNRLLWGQDFYRMVKYAEAAAETDTAPVETDTTSEEG
ncbi:MAG TPA: hypothetical protein PLA31_09910 [Clostridia bacterium]|nr:hypothetical protein [Clostridia bacterium]